MQKLLGSQCSQHTIFHKIQWTGGRHMGQGRHG